MRHVGENSPYEWILLTDVDSYIINFNMTISMVIEYAFSDPGLLLNKKYFSFAHMGNKANPTATTFDIMVSVDSTNINVGTMLFRNSNFSRYILNELWSRRKDESIARVADWPEQAVLIHLCRTWPALMSQHLALVHQKVFNSYGRLRPRKLSPHYQFKPGDFLVHFPGSHKMALREFTSQLVEFQPELESVALENNISFQ